MLGGSVPGAVARRYVAFVRRYGRFPFRIALVALLLVGPATVAFYAVLLLRVGTALDGGLPVSPVAIGVGLAAILYAVEHVVVRRCTVN